MRAPCLLLLSFLAAACTAPTRIVATVDDRVRSIYQVADEVVVADVVVLGEQHDSAAVHRTHFDLLRHLRARRQNLVIAMEMFERDVQNVLLEYLSGLIDEATFLQKARPWPKYATDYRPVVEFAKQKGLVVLAANAPRALAQQVGKLGIASVAGNPHVARETTAPEDEYWDAFQATMGDHAGTLGEGAMQRFYQAQCLKDDTMAETIADHLRARQRVGERPLVVLIAGQFHTDHRRGTVARLHSRMPELDIRVLSTETVGDGDHAIYASPRSIGDYVVVVPKQPEPAAPPVAPALPRAGALPKEHPPVAAAPTSVPAEAPAAAPEAGLRPALGLMPDYNAQVVGVSVGAVREGGSAAKAGIEVGDVIVELAGKPVDSVETYTEVLDALPIGKNVAVRVRRGEAEVVLQVLVASRSR